MVTERVFKTGSEFPPLEPGTMRLYSMRLCPYAQRTRIVLAHKNIKYETVNIHLQMKPEWYVEKICPVGQVPAIQKDDVIVYDSPIVNEYLDAVYPENPLLASDPYLRAKDKIFIDTWSKSVKPFYKIFMSGTAEKETISELFSAIDLVESELNKRCTPFFDGQNMGMLDVLLYPHAERVDLLKNNWKEAELDKSRFPKFLGWLDSMKGVPAVKETALDPEIFAQFVEMVKTRKVDYDIGLPKDA